MLDLDLPLTHVDLMPSSGRRGVTVGRAKIGSQIAPRVGHPDRLAVGADLRSGL